MLRVILFWVVGCTLIRSTLAKPPASSSADDYEHHYQFEDSKDRCTTIGVGRKATVDGSTITTHNNDCQDCDFRITHVPARDWPKGSKRPIYSIRDAYPRYVESSTGPNVHGPDYSPDKLDTSLYPYKERKPVAWIDQVPHTYAYTLGTYGIQNEKQVSIGESTCSSVFVGKPVYDGGNATLAMEGLTELALERCDTARCAVQLMGSLAEKYGFYGPEWNGDIQSAQDEAGEGITVSDPFETWVFHVLPDDTGTSAIWAAQRVPDDHITVIANQFIIGHMDLSDHNNFLASSNMIPIAVKHRLWDSNSGRPFHFSLAFGNDRHGYATGCTRRMWRVFTLASPSLNSILSPYTNGFTTFGYGKNLDEPYPFSVKPDKLLSVQDIMNYCRDQFEGTPFDLTTGVGAGAFGDPMRYPPRGIKADPVNGITREMYAKGIGFERPVSLWRTAYSSVTQSRASLPNAVGAVAWIAQYAPHTSTFVPVYANAPVTPTTLKAGTQYKFDKGSNWWIHCLTGNYLSHWYYHTIGDIKTFQIAQETQIFDSMRSLESQAVALTRRLAQSQSSSNSSQGDVVQLLQSWQEATCTRVHSAWWDFFFSMVGKYRDMYKVVDTKAENFLDAYMYLTVPRQWLELVGFWGEPGSPAFGADKPIGIKPLNIPAEDTQEAYKTKYPNGMDYTYSWPYSSSSAQPASDVNRSSLGRGLDFVIGIIVGGILTLVAHKLLQKQHPYLPIR